MKVLIRFYFIFITIILGKWQPVLAVPSSASKGVTAHIERVGGMTHIEFNGKKEWNYDLKKEDGKLLLTLPKLQTKSIEELQRFNSLLIDKIDIDSEHPNKTTLTMHLSDSRVESFDYLTQDPNNLIIDFYVDKDKTLADIRKNKEAAKIAKSSGKGKMPNRMPAFAEFFVMEDGKQVPMVNGKPMPGGMGSSDSELFDFGGFDNQTYGANDLEASVIEAKGNIYLRFPLLKVKNRHLQELQSFAPQYEIRKSFSDENKQARLLLNLFHQRSFASFIKGKKLFKKTFPESSYDEILDYVEADTWVELWKINPRPEYMTRAMNIYRKLIERYPASRIAERTLIQAGLLAHDNEEFFIATKMLRRYLKLYPNSPFNNHIKIYLGDSLSHLNNFDGAKEVYDQVIADNEMNTAAEATYRTGDIYFLKQSFRRAERAYNEALAKFPRHIDKFPNAIFNKAEAQFNMAEYPSSLESYKEFFKRYPTHSYSAYALTRIGELVDLLKHDKKAAQGYYNESFFRFRNSMGGAIARMRSLSQRFKDMGEKELQASIEEMRKLEHALNLHQVDEFSAFMISDGYYDRGDYLKAANTLINYFQVNPKPVNIKKFEKRISRAIAGEIRNLLKKGEVVAALNIIESHQKSWLSKSRRVDVQFFRAVAYEKMKLFDEALESYDRIEGRLSSLEGTKEEKERKVFEYYPSMDQVNLRRAVVNYESKEKKKALSQLNQVKDINALDPQSKADFYFTLSQLSFDSKNYEEALKTSLLVQADQFEDPEKQEKYNVFLSEVYEKNQQFDKAISILEKAYEKFKGEQDQVYVLSRLFQLYRSKGLKDKAIKTGETLLAEYGNKANLDRERYQLGELHFNSGDQKQAQRVWKDLTKKSMWSELAKNKEVSGNWKDETDKKINRIPAMAR